MRIIIIISLFTLLNCVLKAQNKTDVSLFLKKDSAYIKEVYSSTGDLFDSLGHHGPAIENEWLGLRIYFDKRTAIDVYSKAKPGLELLETKWYPTSQQQKEGWGADYYKVDTTVGLGGVRLWDGEKVVPLEPVSQRYARIVKEGTISFMEMLSENIPYKNSEIDILIRVTVYSGLRNAKVEAFALTDSKVQFITGINYHQGQYVVQEENYIVTWGYHPEDVAVEKIEMGAAILFDTTNFVKKIDDGSQHLLVSKPTKHLEYWITSSNERENEINSIEKFMEFVIHSINAE